MTLNVCQADHAAHDSKLVESYYGSIRIWDWPQYMDQPLYCTGQDEVSKSIDVNGYWEKADTELVLSVLFEQPGPVVDFGSHIGWFSMLALGLGCDVLAIEADPQNVELWTLNEHDLREQGHETGRASMFTGWAIDLPPLMLPSTVRLLKVDLEGKDADAIEVTRHLWENRLIDYALIEISPIFHAGYPELVDELRGYGYEASVHKDEGRWVITGADCTFDQENVVLVKLP